ncbi:MAG: tRNA (guanine(10)-N(2))-dimethyltransferase [Candidatus Asgardarchaeia archaeon]
MKELYQIIKEGATIIKIPKYENVLSKKVPVFYNSDKKFDRDLSVLIVDSYLEEEKKDSYDICDLLTGSGIRGIRYYKETISSRKKRIYLIDKNPRAVNTAIENIKLNKLPLDDFNVVKSDANKFLITSNLKFDIIDIDPFGDPLPFIQNALFRIKHNGLLMITATDTAPLSGRYPKVAFMKYGGYIQFVEFYPEVAIRLLLKRVEEIASMFEMFLEPLLSYWGGNYVRIFLRVKKNKKEARTLLNRIGFIYYCEDCKYREHNKYTIHKERCSFCNSTNLKVIGEIYIDKISKQNFLNTLLNKAKYLKNRVLEEFIEVLIQENTIDVPYFYTTDTLASLTKISEKRINLVVDMLRKLGFKASRVHSSKKGFKTNADYNTILETYREV